MGGPPAMFIKIFASPDSGFGTVARFIVTATLFGLPVFLLVLLPVLVAIATIPRGFVRDCRAGRQYSGKYKSQHVIRLQGNAFHSDLQVKKLTNRSRTSI